jgi:sigma54-dependent transcription regulator
VLIERIEHVAVRSKAPLLLTGPTGAGKSRRGAHLRVGQQVRSGTFREDLLARIDLWTFRLPSLRDRPEDLEPNLD